MKAIKHNKFETLGAFVLATVFAFPVLSEDITAAVRAATGSASYGLTGGTEYSTSYPIRLAFDGQYAADGHRAMISPDGSGGPISVYYHISSDFRPGESIVVTNFTMRRSPQSYDSDRTPLAMRLEASPSGDAEADDWVLLAENYEDFPGCASGHVPTADEISFSVKVPKFRQASYRHYRFVFNPRPTFVNNFHELFLNGIISTCPTPERLTWSGGSAQWDSSSLLWKNTNGTLVAWSPFSTAVSSNALAVSGAKDVAALDFVDKASAEVSGSPLRFAAPSSIGLRDSATVQANVSSLYGQDTETACVSGSRKPGYTYLPRSGTDQRKGLETIWWQNRRLRDITGFASAVLYYSGDGINTTKPQGVKHFVNDGQTASVWFWRYYTGSSDRCAWIAAKVQFRQVGNDITAKILCGGFAWVAGFDQTQGAEIDYEANKLSFAAGIYDDTGNSSMSYNFGVKNMLAFSHAKDGLDVVSTRHLERCLQFMERLPHDATDTRTGSNVLFATNIKLSEITGFSSAAFYLHNPTNYTPAAVHNMKVEDGAVTVQFQRIANPYLLCVKVRFTQVGDDIYARAEYAKFKENVVETGMDFDAASGLGVIRILDASGQVSGGYTVSDIVPVISRAVCSFDGDFAIRGAVAADNVDLAFGGNVTVADEDTFAATPILLKGGSALSLVDGGEATISKLSVAGAITLTFGTNASLSIGELDLQENALVNVVGLQQGASLRIGTSAALPREALKKFTVGDDTMRFVQNAEGYLSVERVPGFRVIFR